MIYLAHPNFYKLSHSYFHFLKSSGSLFSFCFPSIFFTFIVLLSFSSFPSPPCHHLLLLKINPGKKRRHFVGRMPKSRAAGGLPLAALILMTHSLVHTAASAFWGTSLAVHIALRRAHHFLFPLLVEGSMLTSAMHGE